MNLAMGSVVKIATELPVLRIGWFAGMPTGDNGIAMGATPGLLAGVGFAWLSTVRLFLAGREMQGG